MPHRIHRRDLSPVWAKRKSLVTKALVTDETPGQEWVSQSGVGASDHSPSTPASHPFGERATPKRGRPSWHGRQHSMLPVDSVWRVYKRAPLVPRVGIAVIVTLNVAPGWLARRSQADLWAGTSGKYYLCDYLLPGVLWYDLDMYAMPNGPLFGSSLAAYSTTRWWPRVIRRERLQSTILARGLTALRKITPESREFFLGMYLGHDS
jgi:hypothetical protein